MDVTEHRLIGSPSRWIVVFNLKSANRFIGWLAMGRYKHVRAFGYVAETDVWVFFDVHLGGVTIATARGDDATALMAEWCADADLIGMPVRQRRAGIHFGFWCVPAIKHLLGLRTRALIPDALWRHCLRHGGEIIHGNGSYLNRNVGGEWGCRRFGVWSYRCWDRIGRRGNAWVSWK